MNQILVVDDSLSVRKALEKILSPHAEVTVAIHAEDALAQIGAGLRPRLVISDVLMPGMSGFELTRALRHVLPGVGVPVVLISGVIDDDVHRQMQEVGAAAVVHKPFTAEELLPVIRRALGEAQTAPQVVPDAEPEPLYDPELISGPPTAPTSPPGPPDASPDIGGSESSDVAALMAELGKAQPERPAARIPAAQTASAQNLGIQIPDEHTPLPPAVTATAALAGFTDVPAVPFTPTDPTSPAVQSLPAATLVETLTRKPGVLGAMIVTPDGVAAEHSGSLTLAPADLAMYARFFASTAATLGTRLAGGVSTGVQLEYEGRTLLILPYEAAHLLVCLLADANSSSLVRFALRRQRSQVTA